jgi:hypothetical protein
MARYFQSQLTPDDYFAMKQIFSVYNTSNTENKSLVDSFRSYNETHIFDPGNLLLGLIPSDVAMKSVYTTSTDHNEITTVRKKDLIELLLKWDGINDALEIQKEIKSMAINIRKKVILSHFYYLLFISSQNHNQTTTSYP